MFGSTSRSAGLEEAYLREAVAGACLLKAAASAGVAAVRGCVLTCIAGTALTALFAICVQMFNSMPSRHSCHLCEFHSNVHWQESLKQMHCSPG